MTKAQAIKARSVACKDMKKKKGNAKCYLTVK
jgi:hypothetical protein